MLSAICLVYDCVNQCVSIYILRYYTPLITLKSERGEKERERGCLSPRARAPLEYEWFFLLLSLLLAFEVWWRQSYVTGREARQTGLFTPAPSPPSLPPLCVHQLRKPGLFKGRNDLGGASGPGPPAPRTLATRKRSVLSQQGGRKSAGSRLNWHFWVRVCVR